LFNAFTKLAYVYDRKKYLPLTYLKKAKLTVYHLDNGIHDGIARIYACTIITFSFHINYAVFRPGTRSSYRKVKYK